MRSRPLLIATLLCALLWPAAAQAARLQEAQFQDDNRIVYAASPGSLGRTLNRLAALGVDRIRVSVFWKLVAPAPNATARPAFDAADPAAYPQGAWDRYDNIVRQAAARGIQVNFNITSPAPNWATGTAPRADIDPTFDPKADEFRQFVQAVGNRYGGKFLTSYVEPPLPRVTYWSIWNEPNQPGWLTPQWARDPRNAKKDIETAPRIYRDLVDAAWKGLQASGHGSDTILIGETAPKGQKDATGTTRAISVLRFIRDMYCLDGNLQFFQGTSAQLRGCPVADQAGRFVADHPGLFRFTGWAHHPYELTFAPHTKPTFKDWVTIANLPDLSRVLRRIFQRYGQGLPGGAKQGVPLYLTEFGYQTNPPDPTAVSPAKQAAYINESEYIAWRNPTVKTLTQFLLTDDKPVAGVPRNSPDAWLTFQSGLLFQNGRKKPAYRAYEMPFYMPRTRVRRGRKLFVWGGVRVAPANQGQTVSVQQARRRRGPYRRIATARTEGVRQYFGKSVRFTRSGWVRLGWRDAKHKRTLHTRSVRVTVRR